MVLTKVKVNVKKLHPEAKIPFSATGHAAGFDLYSVEDTILEPGETKAIGTGLSLELPEGTVCFFWDRSGMGFKGIHRFAGVIDSDYRGEYKVILFNSTKEPFKIEKGDRIAQAVIQDYYTPEFTEKDDLTDTERGEGGFGASGMK